MKKYKKVLAAVVCIIVLLSVVQYAFADTDVKAFAKNAYYLVVPNSHTIEPDNSDPEVGDICLDYCLLEPNIHVFVDLPQKGVLTNNTSSCNYELIVTTPDGQVVAPNTIIMDGVEVIGYTLSLGSHELEEYYTVLAILSEVPAEEGLYRDRVPVNAGLHNVETQERLTEGKTEFEISLRAKIDEPVERGLVGDVNNDTFVNVADVSTMMRFIVHYITADAYIYNRGDATYYTAENLAANGVPYANPNYVFELNSSDGSMTLRYIAGIIPDTEWYYTDGTTVAASQP